MSTGLSESILQVANELGVGPEIVTKNIDRVRLVLEQLQEGKKVSIDLMNVVHQMSDELKISPVRTMQIVEHIREITRPQPVPPAPPAPPSTQAADDPVNHPVHYNSHPSGVECIEITRHMTFNAGNAIKYLWRAGLKDITTAGAIQDLQKASWYLNDEIQRLEKMNVDQGSIEQA